jgi:hypothetical protein
MNVQNFVTFKGELLLSKLDKQRLQWYISVEQTDRHDSVRNAVNESASFSPGFSLSHLENISAVQ